MINDLYQCDCSVCSSVSDAVSTSLSISEDEMQRIMKEIYDGMIDEASGISPTLYQIVRDYYHTAVEEGKKKSIVTTDDEEQPDILLENRKNSVDVFSLHRTANQCNLLIKNLIDSEGYLKDYEDWWVDCLGINGHYNEAWLRTEYDTAILRSQMAEDWKQYEDAADALPNLRWMRTTSVAPRDNHKAFWSIGLTLPIDDPFWSKHRPGDQWNCKCWLEQTDEASTPRSSLPEEAKMPEVKAGLKGNPAKTGEVFSQDHPHFPSSCASCYLNTDGKIHGQTADNMGSSKGDCNICSMMQRCKDRLEKIKI